MRAWQVTRYGRRPRRSSWSTRGSDPWPGEILVRATASVFNYNEVDGCHGRYLTIDPPLPYTLGMECVGEVVAAAPAPRMARSPGDGERSGRDRCARRTTSGRRRWRSRPRPLTTSRRPRSSIRSTSRTSGSSNGAGSTPARPCWCTPQRAASGRPRCNSPWPPAPGSSPRRRAGEGAVRQGPRRRPRHRPPRRGLRDAVLEATGGHGVDVCFDGVGGDVMMKSLRCLGRGGRHLVIGFAGGIETEEVPMVSGRMLCFGNFDVVGVILAYRRRGPPARDGLAAVPVPRFNAPPAGIGGRSSPTCWSCSMRANPPAGRQQGRLRGPARSARGHGGPHHDRPRRHHAVTRKARAVTVRAATSCRSGCRCRWMRRHHRATHRGFV